MTEFSPQTVTALLWIAWCALHSLLISHWWLRLCRHMLGDRIVTGLYRLIFNGVSFLTLLPVVLYQFSVSQVVIFDWPGWWLGLKVLLYCYAFFMFDAGLKRYDLSFFMGIKQLRAFTARTKIPVASFVSNSRGGVRHPWYSAGIALVWAFGSITDISLVSKIVISFYFVAGTLLEERKLHQDIGEAYEDYCRKLPMLFPWRKVKK